MESKFYKEGETSDQGYDVTENDCPVCGAELHHMKTDLKLKTITTQWNCLTCFSSGEEVFDVQFVGQRVKVEHSLENRDD